MRRLSALAISSSLLIGQTALAADAQLEFFEKRIRPVLVKHCYECHSKAADEIGGNFLLDTREGIRRGGDSGHAVVPSDVSSSLLIQAIRYESFEMPPDERLPESIVRDFEKWIRMGAQDPRDGTAARPADARSETELWSLQPVANDPVPVTNESWPRNEIDQFIWQSLESEGLQPAADADPLTLLRRTYFDLIGLPPTADQQKAFLADPSPAQYEAVVDRLLASPAFGERWGRHWLDVVRFGESNGRDRDVLLPHAWRYRNYVIDALNNDVPYDRFVLEQVAGDLLPWDSLDEHNRLRVATGMLAVGSKSLTGGGLQTDLIDDQIDVVTRAFLGLTASCARCHDHKFDPIPTRDYYALAGIFGSTETRFGGGLRRPKDQLGKTDALLVLGDHAAEIAEMRQQQKSISKLNQEEKTLQKKLAKLKSSLPESWRSIAKQLRKSSDEEPIASRDEIRLIRDYLQAEEKLAELTQKKKALETVDLDALEFAIGVQEASKIADSAIHIRGERSRLGEKVPRGFLTCFELPDSFDVAADQSGRFELGLWLTHPENPLISRVIVNRLWLHLFGRGLVESVDNFGVNGSPPSHPALLDYLARQFVAAGWSQKKAIRQMVLSRTYQLGGALDEANFEIDPDNRFYWRARRRRLEAEAIRDAMLVVAGELKTTPPVRSPVAEIGDGEFGRGIDLDPVQRPFPHRSVYLPIIRGMVPEILKTFDFPEPSNIQGQRDVTNVPAQSLYLMNSPFVIAQAERFAGRVLDQPSGQRVDFAFATALGRPPTSSEHDRSREFLERFGDRQLDERARWASFCHAIMASAEFRYVQ